MLLPLGEGSLFSVDKWGLGKDEIKPTLHSFSGYERPKWGCKRGDHI
jgi:hypothetical protein